MYSCNKDPHEAKYELLINKCKSVASKCCNDSKAFLVYLNDMDNNYQNIDEYNPKKKGEVLIWNA